MSPDQRLTLLLLAWFVAQGVGLNIQIEELYAKSFVPNGITVTYYVDQREAINFNMSVKEQFPGKLLMHIFVRQLSNESGGQWTNEMFKLKNMDFCKTLESLRNLTTEHIQGDSLLPLTFLISCPLVPGYYYVQQGVFDVSLLPIRIPDGRYFAQFELIQVYEEVIKLLTCKIKCKKETPPGYEEATNISWSDEEEEKKPINKSRVTKDMAEQGSSEGGEQQDNVEIESF